ncbi:MAG TPA: penicillin-binding protein 2 [Candidatus Limnocylindrales bacterium]|nr:penicillin-binding protein 2 [Candidatus Limnocylindrales bacterium]
MTTELAPARPEGRPALRFIAFGIVIILTSSLLLVRLFALQVTAGARYTALATANRTEVQAIPSTRGLIFDRSGRPLVTNVASYSVKIRPADLPESRRGEVVDALANLLGKDPLDINLAIDSNPGSRYDLVRVASNVDPTVANFISESSQDLPGVEVEVETQREYPYGPLFSQILGYTGPINAAELDRLAPAGYQPDDLIGRAGVEATYEDQLRGQYGLQTVERDATGRQIQVLQTNQNAVPGSSLRLTIDLHMQQLAEQALAWGMKAAHLKRGAFIVMNPQTGEILAMASQPTYDDNLFAQGISTKQYQAIVNDPNHPLLNQGISNQYPPGSTFKMVTSIAALADGRISTAERLRTAGFLELGGQRFYDWNLRGFGLCNLQCGFANSSDTYFYQVAARVGIDRLSYWAHQLGFGAPTGIDLPNEASGTIPSNQWKMQTFGEAIRPGEVYLAGIGQGYDAVTPLQLLDAYCAVINGGTLLAPRVVEDVIGPDGQVSVPYTPQVVRKLNVSAAILRTMRVNARHVVTGGHTLNLYKEPFIVAGKTGTAQFGVALPNGNLPYHEWFVGWVPKDPWSHASDPGGYQAAARTDSQLAFVAFSYDANTRGNPSTEISKYFLQLYFGTTKDYRLLSELQRAKGY